MGKRKSRPQRKSKFTVLHWGALATLISCNLVSWETWIGLGDTLPIQSVLWIVLIWVGLPLFIGLILGLASNRLAKSEKSKLFFVLALSLIIGVLGKVLAPVWGAILFLGVGVIASLISSVSTFFN